MAVIGLVPGLTVEAANQAALGAGAKLIGSWSFKLREQALAEIEAQRPDMVLLTGGTDGGDSETILHNARFLAGSRLTVVSNGDPSSSQKYSRRRHLHGTCRFDPCRIPHMFG